MSTRVSHVDDPDVGLVGEHGPVIAVIAAGGALGALARLGVSTVLPHHGGFPLSTVLENVLGCFLLGALLVVLTELRRPHPLVRPFLGTGVLGGFTTFSTYAVDAVTRDSVGVAVLSVVLTLVLALAGSWAGVVTVRRIGGAR
jgi:CrcB protein